MARQDEVGFKQADQKRKNDACWNLADEFPENPAHEKHGREGQDGRQNRRSHCRPDFLSPLNGGLFRGHALFHQTNGIVGHHNRVVDQHPRHDDEADQRHQIQRIIEVIKSRHRPQERKRDAQRHQQRHADFKDRS